MKNINYLIKLYIFVFVINLIGQIQNTMAQLPVNDPAWIKDTTLSDDFGGSTLKTYKWAANDSVWDGHSLAMDFNRPNHNNVQISNGVLTLHADTLVPSRVCLKNGVPTNFYYQSGAIHSINPSFKYGYLEFVAKFPTGNRLYWPAFWLWKDSCNNGDSSSWYNEIDITENGGDASKTGKIMSTNWHLYETPDSCSNSALTDNIINVTTPLLSADWHKYALQWDSGNMYFFFDDTLVRTVTGTDVPKHDQYLIIDFYIIPWGNRPHMPAADFKIAEFNYYKLNADCDNNLIISNPTTDYYNATPARAVKKTITTKTVGGSSPTFNLSDNCTLRATDYILLDEGTTINGTGTGQFSAIVTPCPE